MITQRVFPFFFGVGTLLALVLVVVGTANRGVFAVMSASGGVCSTREPRPACAPVTDGPRLLTGRIELALPPRCLCQPTNVLIEGGVTYRAQTVLPGGVWNDANGTVERQGTWLDNTHPVVTPAGFSSGDNWFVLPWLPFRRVIREQWFVPVARVGEFPTEHHPLNATDVVFTPRVSGPLYLFVNDAVFVWPQDAFYRNNDERSATIYLERAARVADTSTTAPPQIPPRPR